MWSSIRQALKRPATPADDSVDDSVGSSGPDVMTSVFEQHPNLSVFHGSSTGTEVPFPTPSPPPSPSRGRLSLRRRLSRSIFNDGDSVTSSSSKIGISIPNIPKKVKSSLQSITTGSDISVNRSSADSRHSQDNNQRPSIESTRPPTTPVPDSKYGSLRSILKPNNTPGTGQSVRFFSRDAYKVLTPEASNSSDFEDPSLFPRLQKISPPRRHVQEVFSPPPQEPATPITPAGPSGPLSLMMPIPPPDLSNIFDISDDRDLPTIPHDREESLLDSAIEIAESDDQDDDDTSVLIPAVPREKVFTPPPRDSVLESSPTVRMPIQVHDRSHSFSFGQTVFHSMGADPSSLSDPAKSPNKFGSVPRNRALSDTVFHSMVQSASAALGDSKRPEADINDTSTAIVALGSPDREKDPFGANSRTYYTPGTMLPPSPPPSNHTRTASREEDIIWSLKTQLALQTELCAQYEVDLSARNELVETLTARLVDVEKECDRRKSVVRAWRKKVSELEKCVRGLEEEVERSREDSLERSVMDEASGEALRMLHRQLANLEREKAEVEKRENELKEELAQKVTEVDVLRDELKKRDESERELKDGILAAQEEFSSMGSQRQSVFHIDDQEQFRALMTKNTQSTEQQEERHRLATVAWEEERTQLLADNDSVRVEQVALQSQLTDVREDVVKKEQEVSILRNELEAQWKTTEKMNEQIDALASERDSLKAEVDELQERINTMEIEWNDSENKKTELDNEIQELWTVREELEHERDELEGQLQAEQEHAEGLTQALQEQESRITLITQERQYANDSVTRLQESLRQRDAEIAEHKKRAVDCENEVEDVRAEMIRMKREHSRTVDEQSRTLSDVIAREVEARANMENMIREKAENDVSVQTLRDNVKSLNEEIEKLRKQLHNLLQESADKDIKLAQAAKQRSQDKEDLQGLNIALDSKQQELELLKRRVATKTSPTAAPAPAAKAPHRRESSIFGTPGAPRPSSVLSDATASTSTDRRKSSDPSVIAKPTLARSVRVNTTSHPPISAPKRTIEGSMGPPPIRRSLLVSPTSSTTPLRASTATRGASVTPTATAARRRMSASIEPKKPLISGRESIKSPSSASERDEKENVRSPPTAKPIRRISKVPVPA